MFETSTETEFGPYGRRRWRRRFGSGQGGSEYGPSGESGSGWSAEGGYRDTESEGPGYGLYGESEGWAGEGGYGETEGWAGEGGYGETEGWAGEGGYGETEGWAGEGGYGETEGWAGEGGYGETEGWAGEGGYGETEGWAGEGGYGETEGWAGEGGYGETEGWAGEEQFLPFLAPLVPLIGQALGGVLGGLGGKRREAEWMGEDGEAEQGWAGEAEEQFLHKVLLGVLGKQSEQGGPAMSPAQEAQFVNRLLEVSAEDEVDEILSRIVNTVGRAVQGVARAVGTPQGRALVEALRPVVRTALPMAADVIGGPMARGSSAGLPPGGGLFEMESAGESEDEQRFEAAQRVVRLASGAAGAAALAPAGAPPQLVGELAVVNEIRHIARPLFGRILRAFSPLARRYYGRRYSSVRGPAAYRRYGSPGYGYRRYGYPGYGYRRYGRVGPSYGPGYRWGRPRYGGYAPQAPEPEPEPSPAPPPPQPGYRWVRVPIDAPPPPPPPAPPEPPGSPAPAGGAPPEGAPPAQSEFGYGRYRRRRYRDYGGDGGDGGFGGSGGSGRSRGGPSGRWIRRGGKIVLLDV